MFVAKVYAVTEMIKCMYSTDLLAATEITDLLDVLVAVDKYSVLSCVRHCTENARATLYWFTQSLETEKILIEWLVVLIILFNKLCSHLVFCIYRRPHFLFSSTFHLFPLNCLFSEWKIIPMVQTEQKKERKIAKLTAFEWFMV